MIKKTIILSIACLVIAGCTLPQTSKIVTGGMVSTNFESNTIQIKNYTYDPSDISVKGGSTIKITNNDSVAHTLTADNKSFDTGSIEPGQTVDLVIPSTDGTYGFYCIPHPYMKGKLIVTNSPTPAPTE